MQSQVVDLGTDWEISEESGLWIPDTRSSPVRETDAFCTALFFINPWLFLPWIPKLIYIGDWAVVCPLTLKHMYDIYFIKFYKGPEQDSLPPCGCFEMTDQYLNRKFWTDHRQLLQEPLANTWWSLSYKLLLSSTL